MDALKNRMDTGWPWVISFQERFRGNECSWNEEWRYRAGQCSPEGAKRIPG